MARRSRQPRDTNQARIAAGTVFELVASAFRSGKPVDRELAAFFRRHRKFGSSERRLVTETVFAVFRWWGWLRHLVRDEERLWTGDARTRAQSREWLTVVLAAHLLEAQDHMHPTAATWRDTLVKRHRRDFPPFLPCLGGEPLDERAAALKRLFRIAVDWRELVPEWVVTAMSLNAPRQRDLVEALQTRPPIWLRTQTPHLDELQEELRGLGIQSARSGAVPTALRLLPTRLNVYELEPFRRGDFEIQDLASQVIGLACAATAGERWWDACAGAGGKSLQLAAMMDGKGTVVATDIRAHKLEDLRRRARRARLSNINARPWDGKTPPGRNSGFDGVLVDAPCTCAGTWRRNPDARWTTLPTAVEEIVPIQQRLLDVTAKAVRPGGRLVYATCSCLPAENDAVVDHFLSGHPAFALAPTRHPLTGAETDGRITVWPKTADSDASYVACLRRQG
jgi:16S rRNA (cytosine967-C5)-methyltransferase